MPMTFSGSVHYANGSPIPGVAVRIFDKDSAGKQDDDLTVIQGISDDQGRFTLTYEPLRYLDYHTLHLHNSAEGYAGSPGDQLDIVLPDLGDSYLPYLRFTYTYIQAERTYTAGLTPFRSRFYLSVNPPVTFLPSVHGFKFRNCFPGFFFPYSTPAFLGRKVPARYGLCGGMCAASYDFLLAGMPIPIAPEVPSQGSRLQRYLFRRQLDSMGGLGQAAVEVARWTSLPDDTLLGTCRRTADEMPGIRQKLDDGNLVILALIYEHAMSLKQLSRVVFNNHQVLVFGYRVSDLGVVTLQIYDPNLPGRDDVAIQAVPIQLGQEDSPSGPQNIQGYASSQLVSDIDYRQVRGFFTIPYTAVSPPKNQ